MSAEKKERSHTEFAAAAEPLIKWLNANAHPMMAVVVTQTSAELFEGVMRLNTQEYLLD